jgi:hypothetical protein
MAHNGGREIARAAYPREQMGHGVGRVWRRR